MTIRIGRRLVGPDHPPMLIAELSGNHNGRLERALALIDAAKAAGADAVKLQTYTADTMTLDCDGPGFRIVGGLWDGRTLYDLYKEAATPWEWHGALFQRARESGLEVFSSPFDSTAIDFLESLGAPAYKIASFENVDLALIRRAAATGKPLIVSSGLASEAELGEAVAAARSAGCRELLLLKCTSSYPASPAESHLATIPDMARRFGCLVGVSDHTPGIGAAVAAVALGAVAIEKHLTLARGDGGVDAAFSLEPEELQRLVAESRRAWEARGSVQYGPSEGEKSSLVFRRSLYVVRDMKAGERFTGENVRAVRPGYGLAPKHLDEVLGKPIRRAAERGTPLTWDLVGERP